MPLLVPCVKCQRQLRVKDDLAGKTVRCPHCDSGLLVPAVSNPEAPPTERASGDRAGAGRAKPTNSPPPRGSHDDPAGDELADVAMISRKLPSRGALGRAFDSVWAALSARRRELGVGATIVVGLLALQFGWDFLGNPRPAARPQAAAANEPSDAEATETSSAAIVNDAAGKDAPAEPAAETTSDQSETTPESEKRVQLRPPAQAPATAQTTPAGSLPKRSPEKTPPAKSSETGEAAAETSSDAPAQRSAAGASRKSASSPSPVGHKGTYTVENPPQVGEVVVVRLKDGLHVAKVTSVELSELRCEVTVIESAAYNKGGTIRETKQTGTARFGQLRVPTHPKAKPSAPGGLGGPEATM
jgi:DNA-directed RNA polymerase subunit RPC12/RpoP